MRSCWHYGAVGTNGEKGRGGGSIAVLWAVIADRIDGIRLLSVGDSGGRGWG